MKLLFDYTTFYNPSHDSIKIKDEKGTIVADIYDESVAKFLEEKIQAE